MKEKDEPYKVELIEDLPEEAVISFYQPGRIYRPVRRPPSDDYKGDRQGIQAHEHCRRLLARQTRKIRC